MLIGDRSKYFAIILGVTYACFLFLKGLNRTLGCVI